MQIIDLDTIENNNALADMRTALETFHEIAYAKSEKHSRDGYPWSDILGLAVKGLIGLNALVCADEKEEPSR